MGLGYNHTYSVCHGSTVVARSCSFQASPWKEGPRYTAHKGKLMEPLDNSKVVVKAYYVDQNSNGGSTEVAAEMKKWNFAKKTLRECSGPTKESLELVRTLESRVETEGKVSKLKKKIKAKSNHHISEGMRVVIQDFVPDQIQSFNFQDISAPDRNRTQNQTLVTSSQQAFQDLMHKSYNLSGGSCVISAAKGVVLLDPNGNDMGTFLLTSLTVHSRRQEFGEKDLGVRGVEKYEEWSGLRVTPHTLSRIPASAPPSELKAPTQESQSEYFWSSSSTISQQRGRWGSTNQASIPLGLFPLREPCMNQVVNSSHPHAGSGDSGDSVDSVDSGDSVDFGESGPGGHERPLLVRRRTLEDVLATAPELRSCCPEGLLNIILGPAPAYSSEQF